jgi:hypothetical protein
LYGHRDHETKRAGCERAGELSTNVHSILNWSAEYAELLGVKEYSW